MRSNDKLYVAGGAQRLVTPRLDGSPLLGEVDYDELNVSRHWREYERFDTDATRYLMYELSHRDVGQMETETYYKAVRLIRVTRVPRYLRQAGKDNNSLFDQQRDVLAALYQENVLFLTMIAKAPDLPLVFAYGVQATGDTPEEAKYMADRSFAVLAGQLDGTYQQLEYQPLTVTESEKLVRYQNEWNYLAMARGRPKPTGGSSSMGGILDGNRTDTEQTANQLESFIRGMGESEFMVSLVTVPVPPLEITRAWRNLSQTLSDVRSDTEGVRGLQAGVAVPLGFGLGQSDNVGQSHSMGDSLGQGITDTEGSSYTAGVSETEGTADTLGVSAGESFATTEGVSDTIAVTEGLTEGVSLAQGQTEGVSLSEGLTQGESLSEATSYSEGVTAGQSIAQGQSASEQYGQSESVSQSAGLSQSQSLGQSASLAQSEGVNTGESVQVGESAGANWANSANQGLNGSLSLSEGWSDSVAEGLSQGFGVSDASGDQMGDSRSEAISRGFGGRFAGFQAGMDTQEGSGVNRGMTDTDTLSSQLGSSSTLTSGINSSLTEQLGESLGVSESVGGSAQSSLSQGASVGQSHSLTATEAVNASQTEGVSQSAGISQGQSRALGFSESLVAGQSLAQSQTIGQSAAASQSIAQSQTAGQSVAQSQTVGQSSATSQSASQAQSVSQSQSQAVSRTESAAHTQSASRSVSEAAGVTTARAVSASRGASDAYMASMGRTAQSQGSLGLIPSVGVHMSRQTRDEAKRILGDMLDAQVKRYVEGVESGAFMYQMSLVCGDPETLARASGLLKSAFWGPGENNARLPHPFHVIDEFEPGEAERILGHVRAFSSYRRREPEMANIEPFLFSSYLTPGEGAAFSHPPTAEAPGIMAMQDSMPVFAMPSDRGERDIHLGHVVNGERAKISPLQFGIDVSELTHTLVAGVTGSGKTTTVLRLLSEAVRAKKTVTRREDPKDPLSAITSKEIPSGALCLDWQKNMRNLATVVEPERFRFFSLAKPAMGQFRWNLLSVPSEDISPVEWANTVADLFMISYGLGEFARSIIWEHINDLYSANRLEPMVLREPVTDATGTVIRPGIALPALDEADLPPSAIQHSPDGTPYANVYTHPELSRLIGISELAISVLARIEELSSSDAGRMHGTEIRNRYQTVWRRLQYFAPGGPLSTVFSSDPDLNTRHCLTVPDIVDPDRGLVTVIEADGLDLGNRRLVLGGIFMSVWRFGQAIGEGAFNNGGDGPGTFICLEEAHELFGSQGDGEDRETAATRTALWESIYRRSRQVGLRLIACVQNPGDIPAAIYSNSSTALIHRLYDDRDRKVVRSLMNWNSQFDHRREERYLGEMPIGWCLARLDAKNHYLEAVPVHFVTDPANLSDVSDLQLLEASAAAGTV